MIIKLAILLVIVLIVVAFAAWAFLPARHLPGNRARHLRVRLHLRLHPGKGFAHLFSLWLRWSRFAVLRRSGQIRPALPWRYNLLDPGEHSVSARFAEARAALIRVLSLSVTDAELEGAYEAFDNERGAGLAEILEAGHGKAHWLAEHVGAPAAEWDQIAMEALHLLGLGGDERGRAELLFNVGTQVIRRADATQAQAAWAIRCLRDSRDLWRDLGEGDQEAAAGHQLAMALYAWDYGDAYATVSEAEAIMREVMAHYERAPQPGMLAMAMTNLAIILLKAATMDERRDRIQEAVDLCRRALPLRPKTQDPGGWAFSAANLALALKRLGSDETATRRAQLEEAAVVSEEAVGILDAQGEVQAADQARVNRLDALLGLASELRDERLRTAAGVDETELADLLEIKPAVFDLAQTPPAIAEIVRGPAAPDEARILKTVLAETTALLAEPQAALDSAARSRIARLAVNARSALLGLTQEAGNVVAAAPSGPVAHQLMVTRW
jgi:hypothetical protein